ncbi:MAG: LysR family transcriptional regulator [Alphaproteobacteria bacterium]|nr:MAG: LysR family transcriptional regulator [Alphaproteobacteria bacterium]
MRYTLRQLQIFRTVAETLSYTAAAGRLHLTQPAVFGQVRQLEAQLGQALIERLGRRLHLTEAGERAARGAASVLAAVERLDAEMAELKGLGGGRLHLAVVSTAKYMLPRLLGPFSAAHPGLDIRLTVGNRRELLERFSANLDDLYVLGALPDGLAAHSRPLAENPLIVIAPPDHPLAAVRKIDLATLAAEPFVMREPGSGTRRAAEQAFAAAGLAPRVRLELGANEAVKQAVMAGLGLSVLSQGTVQLEIDHGYLVALDVAGFPLRRTWSIAWHRGKRLSRAAQAFLDSLPAAA